MLLVECSYLSIRIVSVALPSAASALAPVPAAGYFERRPARACQKISASSPVGGERRVKGVPLAPDVGPTWAVGDQVAGRLVTQLSVPL